MAFVMKFIKGVRNHWKKSTFLTVALAYGINYTKEYYQTQELMKEYCLEALRYGDEVIPDGVLPRTVTVILNPTANKRKAAKQFEKYCAPILHLAGISVDVLQTESEGHARRLVKQLKKTDAIIVAGGDGTISEVITGLFRRTENDDIVNPCPIGILPLGRTNTVAKVLFPGGESLATVRSLADASMAVVQENVKRVDVMKIEIINDAVIDKNSEVDNINTEITNSDQNNLDSTLDNSDKELKNSTNEESKNLEKNENLESTTSSEEEEETEGTTKPVYALASFEWGAYRDAYAKEEKYWYWGGLRKYVTYIFNGYKKDLTWECNAELSYREPCSGCSNCYVKPKSNVNTRWWARLFTKPSIQVEEDYSKILNERCSQIHRKDISTLDFNLTTVNVFENPSASQLVLKIGPRSTKYVDFVTEGFKTLKGQNRDYEDVIQARQIEILPKPINDSKEIWFSIDREEYEAKPVRITLLPRVLQVYCKQSKNV